jgi:glycosyltransferase involved in cell wall biosynthesis
VSKLKISIITVTFNAESVIDDSIHSIISQDYDNKEIIIIDGLSIDETISKINSFKNKIDIFLSEKDLGIYDAMNKGLELASGDFVIFMNAGDFFFSNDTISKVVNFITQKNAIYYGNAIYISEDKNLKYERGGVFNKFRLASTNICHQTIFYPKTVYKSEKYNINYRLFADWEYNMRCCKNNIRFLHINETISLYDHTGISIKQRDLNFEREVKKIIFKNLGVLPIIYLGIRKYYKKIRNNQLWK